MVRLQRMCKPEDWLEVEYVQRSDHAVRIISYLSLLGQLERCENERVCFMRRKDLVIDVKDLREGVRWEQRIAARRVQERRRDLWIELFGEQFVNG